MADAFTEIKLNYENPKLLLAKFLHLILCVSVDGYSIVRRLTLISLSLGAQKSLAEDIKKIASFLRLELRMIEPEEYLEIFKYVHYEKLLDESIFSPKCLTVFCVLNQKLVVLSKNETEMRIDGMKIDKLDLNGIFLNKIFSDYLLKTEQEFSKEFFDVFKQNLIINDQANFKSSLSEMSYSTIFVSFSYFNKPSYAKLLTNEDLKEIFSDFFALCDRAILKSSTYIPFDSEYEATVKANNRFICLNYNRFESNSNILGLLIKRFYTDEQIINSDDLISDGKDYLSKIKFRFLKFLSYQESYMGQAGGNTYFLLSLLFKLFFQFYISFVVMLVFVTIYFIILLGYFLYNCFLCRAEGIREACKTFGREIYLAKYIFMNTNLILSILLILPCFLVIYMQYICIVYLSESNDIYWSDELIIGKVVVIFIYYCMVFQEIMQAFSTLFYVMSINASLKEHFDNAIINVFKTPINILSAFVGIVPPIVQLILTVFLTQMSLKVILSATEILDLIQNFAGLYVILQFDEIVLSFLDLFPFREFLMKSISRPIPLADDLSLLHLYEGVAKQNLIKAFTEKEVINFSYEQIYGHHFAKGIINGIIMLTQLVLGIGFGFLVAYNVWELYQDSMS